LLRMDLRMINFENIYCIQLCQDEVD